MGMRPVANGPETQEVALMATRRNTDAPSAPIDRSIAGLAARQVAQGAVADLIGKTRGFALEDALAQASRAAGLDAADAGLARAIATATFRRLGFLRRVLAARMSQGLPEDQPRLVALLATGAVQILDLNVPDHAAVDLGVRLAKADPQLQHLPGLVNAVLRRIVRERAEILAEPGDPLADNTPDWLARRWTSAYGPETARAIAAAHLQGRPSTSRCGVRSRIGPSASAASPCPPAACACTMSAPGSPTCPAMPRGNGGCRMPPPPCRPGSSV